MKWLPNFDGEKSTGDKKLSTTPTSSSLMALGVTFVIAMLYFYWSKPEYVLDKAKSNTKAKVVSIRLALVYALLAASTVGLVVFGYQYFMQKKGKKDTETESKSSSRHSKSRSHSSTSKK